jgi:hypothetical protein
MIWASPSEQGRFARELAAFTATVAALPQDGQKRTELPASLSAIVASSSDATEEIVP